MTQGRDAARATNGGSSRGSFTARIGMWCARRRWWVLGAWLVVLVAGLAGSSIVGTNTSVEGEAPGETGRAYDLITERFNADDRIVIGTSQEILVVTHPALSADDPAFRDVVEGLIADLRDLRVQETVTVAGTEVTRSKRLVLSTASHYDLGIPAGQSPFVSTNATGGDVTFAIIGIDAAAVDDDHLDNIVLALDAVAAAQEAAPEGFEILIGGSASLFYQLLEIIEEDFARASYINVPVTFLLLIVAFGALVAAGVPLLLAFAAIALALSVLAFVSQAMAMTEIYLQIVLLMGLATGIDYSLFVISRYRTQRQRGDSKEDALRTATGTSTKAIFFAGATTVFAVLGMFLVGDPIFASLGLAAAVIVALAVFAAMTLLPAVIAVLGDNIDRLRLPFMERYVNRPARIGWERTVDAVLRRPLLPAVLTVVVLLAVTSPVLGINMGFNGPRSFPADAEGTRALIKLQENFTLGLVSPAIVVVDAGAKRNVFAPEIRSAMNEMMAAVEADAVSPDNPQGLYGAITQAPQYNDAGDTAQVYIPLNGDSGEQRAIDAVNRLRDDIIPAAFRGIEADALVAGATAENVDFRSNIIDRTPLVMGFVLLTAFLILLLTFRSLTIAVTAILLNLLSVGAAYGLLVLVFQEGYLLEGLLGFEATGIIESWLPLFLFTILFGASMDYEMFVMSRIKEAYERGLSTHDAIAEGIKNSAGVITNAAAIMVAVAFVFVFMRDISLKQFGFGLGVAVLVDATIIRAFLLPTTMKLLGEWNWYLPSWLRWLPNLPMGEESPTPLPADPHDDPSPVV
jgi:uncharacterized membrane protein YdfJ with MMPL/SSD domain